MILLGWDSIEATDWFSGDMRRVEHDRRRMFQYEFNKHQPLHSSEDCGAIDRDTCTNVLALGEVAR